MDSQDGLDKLFHAEAEASAFIQDAETQARIIANSARDEAEKSEKAKLQVLRAKLERELAEAREARAERLSEALKAYSDFLAAVPLKVDKFDMICRGLVSPED
jgi:hypothetical protein